MSNRKPQDAAEVPDHVVRNDLVIEFVLIVVAACCIPRRSMLKAMRIRTD
ncbi:MAG: hypothetical protein ABSC06_05625 [Rhodopila sp.]